MSLPTIASRDEWRAARKAMVSRAPLAMLERWKAHKGWYSPYARGLESTGGSYYVLDLIALGRQEDWEELKGRTASARAGRPDFAS